MMIHKPHEKVDAPSCKCNAVHGWDCAQGPYLHECTCECHERTAVEINGDRT